MHDVAIVGISTISAAGSSKNEIIKKLKQGISSISDISYFDFSGFSSNLAGNIDSETWEKIKKIAIDEKIDISSALSIYSVKMLLEDVELHSKNIALSVGTCNGGIDSLANFYHSKKIEDLKNYPIYKQMDDISKYFNFSGKKYLFNNACSASGMALSYGAQLIDKGEAEVVIAGGTDPMSEVVFAGFNSLKALSSENCQPYGEKIGLNLGEAATYFALESIQRAKKYNHKIYGTILGYGLSNDAYHPTAPDIDGSGISSAILESLKNSQVNPNEVTYVNSHGTGTRANDISEFTGIKNVFNDLSFPYISSMKGYVGHNLGAAASTELALSLLGLQEGVIFPNVQFENYRTGCNDNRILREVKKVSGDIIFVNDNAAFGGHNVATVLKTNTFGKYEQGTKKGGMTSKVYINKGSFVTDKGFKSFNMKANFATDNILKEYNSKYYQRRMNELTQMGIIAADLVCDKETKETGLVYGTPFGSMTSAERYMNSIIEGGLDKASGIYFQDLVLNSTAGRICKAFDLKSYSSSLSSGGNEDLKSLEIAYNAIKYNFCSNLLVGSGHEQSEVVNQITSKKFKSSSSFFKISNVKTKDAFSIEDIFSFSISDAKELLSKLNEVIERNEKVYIQNFGKSLEGVFDNLTKVEYEEGEFLSGGSIEKLIEKKQENRKIALVSISLIEEIVVVELEK
ncbi:3-oxoacyl-(acyl-carrier-protein) synthase KASII [Lactococcus cremoris]|uniref:3-oxoacyl-(Acyl-carrier-protein) synthase KASII n=1 Tax=Lactococcus lactis subsp. cremoris TaxID=1359 RepID=A0A166KJ28_LACLC|nr:beta-ketoacyl-[acyl-carrier-protein] synthase family protein [Lactococcus cremoris]KZK08429.1 3-oxoacyl-(acyl-carrier-protein) synthase KASII [Lactococcus cremoris]